LRPIPLSVPRIAGKEWQYVKECLDTGWVSSVGSFVDRFEEEVARYTGATHAVACVNGTAALEVALRLVGVRPGDEVLVPTVTFIATVNSVHYAQAHPVFMDCDEYYNLDVEKVREFFRRKTAFKRGQTWNTRTGRRVAAVLPVHVFGNATRLEELLAMSQERSVAVVEDAAESLGTVYTAGPLRGRHTGTVGAVGCLSFNGNKIITCGGGGMILTDDARLATEAKYLVCQAKDDNLRFIHHTVGYNYRLTNLQAAVGVAQLEQLPGFLEVKRRNFSAYREQLRGVAGLYLAEAPGYAHNNHWMYPLQIDQRAFGRGRDRVMDDLARVGIQSRPLWYLNHRQRPYRRCERYRIKLAHALWEKTLCLPCSTDLTKTDIGRVVRAVIGAS
jgi:aminotransferase in exopolysaccharide biosynthesis